MHDKTREELQIEIGRLNAQIVSYDQELTRIVAAFRKFYDSCELDPNSFKNFDVVQEAYKALND